MQASDGIDGPLRFITCGSVDDGKSTLIGRLLADTGNIFSDHRKKLGDRPDYASLLDGLSAEREQGITIDVAHRYFRTGRRSFIVGDAPGHEQYTRNMITAASSAEAALILVDARKGVTTQTRRHGYLAHLLRIRHFILAVNKMDLVDHAEAVFESISREYRQFLDCLGGHDLTSVPVSALNGDNVATRSAEMPWYEGPTIVDRLESLPLEEEAPAPFRLAVQWVSKADFRGYCGMIASGTVRTGDTLLIQPSGRKARVAAIASMDGDRAEAGSGRSVSLVFDQEVDCGRGDVLAAADAPLDVADQFKATLFWMADEPMLPGRQYWLKLATSTVSASVTELEHEVNVDTLEQRAAHTLGLNGIGVATVALGRPLPFTPYKENRDLGGFILIDRETNATVGAGVIHFALRRAHNLHWQTLDVTREAHAAIKRQKPRLLWFTGLSGAGKTTIANLLEKRLHAEGRHTFLLDGDNVRLGLNKDLGFTDADRVENIRRIGEVARLMTDAGLIVLAAFISPFRAERDMVRRMVPDGEFVEIFVDTPLEVAEARDAKGLYAKARRGELSNFTGIDSPYEPPRAPEIRIDASRCSPEEAVEQILRFITASA